MGSLQVGNSVGKKGTQSGCWLAVGWEPSRGRADWPGWDGQVGRGGRRAQRALTAQASYGREEAGEDHIYYLTLLCKCRVCLPYQTLSRACVSSQIGE